MSLHFCIDFTEITKWLWLRFTWLSDQENVMFNKGVRKIKDEINMMSLVKSVRQFEAILAMGGIDENKKLLLERNKINQFTLKYQPSITSPR